ncbi:MAG: hypothetical protein HQK49_02850 [Oligoflexia bacterium]|nr:hypothetical protein [Oligoflexia bacterium]
MGLLKSNKSKSSLLLFIIITGMLIFTLFTVMAMVMAEESSDDDNSIFAIQDKQLKNSKIKKIIEKGDDDSDSESDDNIENESAFLINGKNKKANKLIFDKKDESESENEEDGQNKSQLPAPFLMQTKQTKQTKQIKKDSTQLSDENESEYYALPHMNNRNKFDPTKINKNSELNELTAEDGHLMDSGGRTLLTKEAKDFHRQIESKSKHNFAFVLFKDGYNYYSEDDLFNKMFRDKSSSETPIILQLSQYWLIPHWDGQASFDYGINFGIGYNSGKGLYVNGEKSDITFFLWALPVDLALGYEIYLFSLIKVGIFAGPSAMMITQKRTDTRRKPWLVSYGYFDSAHVKINLTPLFSDSFSKFYRQYSITSFYFNIIYREQHYKKFKHRDDIEIDGGSIGAGFAFDYL